jgi:hypothetical protein
MSAADIAIIAENAVILAAIGAGWSLLRQGGGLQVKPVPVPKAPPKPKDEPQADAPKADPDTAPIPIGRAV